MGGDGTVKKKRHLLLVVLLGLFLAALAGFVSFRLGRREGKTEGKQETIKGGKTEGDREAGTEEAGEGGGKAFGSGSVEVTLCLPDGFPCDFSTEFSAPALVPLADRLVPELEKAEGTAAVAAFYRRDNGTVCHGMDALQGGSVLGIGPDFLAAADLRVEKGRGLTERDVEEGRHAALLDGRAAQALFSGKDPVGGTVEVEGRLYQVVGVVDSPEPRTGGGLTLIPESTWSEAYQYEEPKSVVLKIAEPAGESFMEAEREVLRRESGVHAARVLNSMVPEGEELSYQMQ